MELLGLEALKNVSLNVKRGEFLAIAGPSGSGKTTLLNLIGCIDEPTSGSIEIDGKRIERQSANKLAKFRSHKIGFIFQSFNLIPVLTMFENVEYPLLLQRISREEREKRVTKVLDEVGLLSFKHHHPDELSGGERQRVSIARALVTRPSIILADEPTANLDSTTGEIIIGLMEKINNTEKTTFIFSTHDQKVIEKAHRVVEIKDGMIKD